MLMAGTIMMTAFACASEENIPQVEARAQEINKTVMCPVCPGESIDQSQHPRAKTMRGIVIEKVEEGWTDDQVRQFFVERYGTGVLLEPPREGLSWLVWVVPPLGIVTAALALYLVLRLAVRPVPHSDGGPVDGIILTTAERDDYFKRIKSALGPDSGREGPFKTASDVQDPGAPVAR